MLHLYDVQALHHSIEWTGTGGEGAGGEASSSNSARKSSDNLAFLLGQ